MAKANNLGLEINEFDSKEIISYYTIWLTTFLVIG